MGVERYLLSSSLTGIISQKLARRLCPKCKKLRPTNDYEKKLFKLILNKDVTQIYDTVGCEECGNGYHGRIAIHEVLLINQEIKDAVRQISGISKSQRQKNLSSRPMLEFVTMLYVYNEIVSEKVKRHHLEELKELFYGRMVEKKSYFADNTLIKNSYSFACIMIENLVK